MRPLRECNVRTLSHLYDVADANDWDELKADVSAVLTRPGREKYARPE